jgi:hypothetical protein
VWEKENGKKTQANTEKKTTTKAQFLKNKIIVIRLKIASAEL